MIYQIKKLLKKFKIRDYATPDWNKLIEKNKEEFKFLKKKANGKKILITTSAGGLTSCSHFESLLAFALTYYGAKVEILLCDKVLPACMMATSNFINEEDFSKNGIKKTCNACLDAGKFAFDGLKLKTHYYSDFINSVDIKESKELCKNLSLDELINYKDKEDNMSIGEHSLAGALRYYAVGNIRNQKNNQTILRKFTEAGIITKKVFENILSTHNNIDIIISNHAIYIPQGVICEVTKKYKKKIVSYVTGYRKNSWIFSHGDTYHYTMMTEPVSDWENMDLNEKKENKIMNYLDSRKYGTNDWTYYFDNPEFNAEKILIEKGLDLKKPIVLMTTNIIWDANLIYHDNIFINMMEWIFKTIDYFIDRKDLQLLIRAHPAEVNADRISNGLVKDEIFKKYKKLPKNIFIISSDEKYSTYPLVEYANAILVYASKVAMEFTSCGYNVVVAGE